MKTVARKTSVWSNALAASATVADATTARDDARAKGASFEARGEDEEARVRRAASELRVKLLDEIVRGAAKREPSDEDGVRGSEDADARRARRAGRDAFLAATAKDGDEDEDAIARMRAAVNFVMGFCAEILQPSDDGGSPAVMPPLGTHVILRADVEAEGERSVYFQEQCSYDIDEIRTADHFIDYERQFVHASAKVQTAPRVSTSGSVIDVHFDLPKPSDSSTTNNIREGNFVEVRGCSGHPDYLRRRGECNNSGEVFEFNLPSLRISGLGRAYPVAEIVGEVTVRGCTSGLKTSLKFRPFDVETSPSFRNIVSGTMVRNNTEVKRLILGTWDTRVLLGRICEDRDSLDDVLHAARDFKVPPLTTATGVRSLLQALESPGSMSNKRLWQTIVEALRVANLHEPERSVVQEVLGEPATATREKIEEGSTMAYELAVIVANSPPPDAPPPLPRYWFPRTKKN